MSLAVDVMNEMKTWGCVCGGRVGFETNRGFHCLPQPASAPCTPFLYLHISLSHTHTHTHTHTFALSARAATASLERPGSFASSGAPAASRAFTTFRTAARGRSTSSDDGGSGAGEGEAAAIEEGERRACSRLQRRSSEAFASLSSALFLSPVCCRRAQHKHATAHTCGHTHKVTLFALTLPSRPAPRGAPARTTPTPPPRALTVARATPPHSTMTAPVRVWAISDVHSDYAENEAWVRTLASANKGYEQDVIIVAGDVSDCSTTLLRTMEGEGGRGVCGGGWRSR